MVQLILGYASFQIEYVLRWFAPVFCDSATP